MKKTTKWQPKPKNLAFTTPTLKVIRSTAEFVTVILAVFTLYSLPGIAAIAFISTAIGLYCLIWFGSREHLIWQE